MNSLDGLDLANKPSYNATFSFRGAPGKQIWEGSFDSLSLDAHPLGNYTYGNPSILYFAFPTPDFAGFSSGDKASKHYLNVNLKSILLTKESNL